MARLHRAWARARFTDLWEESSRDADASKLEELLSQRQHLVQELLGCPAEGEIWDMRIRRVGTAAELRDFRRAQKRAMEVTVPVTVSPASAPLGADRVAMTALVDSGATVSCISLAAATRLGLSPALTDGPTQLQLASGTIQRLGSVDIQLSTSGISALVTMEVLAETGKVDILLGVDLMTPFRIGIQMPAPVRRAGGDMVEITATSAETEPVDLRGPDVVSAEHRCSTEICQQVEQGIAEQLRIHKLLDPHVACTHPDAVLDLQLEEGAQLPYTRQYRMAHSDVDAVTAQIETWDERGVTAPGDRGSKANHAIVAVAKKNLAGEKTDVRTCLDFRKLNRLTHDDDAPIPLVQDLFDRCAGFKIASALDLEAGYNQIALSKATSDMTTFRWKGVPRVFKRAPFGLKQMTGFFQRLMETIAEEAGVLARCLIYVDDIVLLSHTVEEHTADLNKLIATLSKYNLRLNTKKCHFAYERLRVLGFLLSGTDKRVDSRKAKAVLDFPRPSSAKQMQSFLGLVNFLRDHVPHMSTLASPLEELRHVKRWTADLWTERRCQAFTNVRAVLQEAPALHLPVPDVPFVCAVDASNFGLGAALWQEVDGERHYLAFASKSLVGSQRNYGATKRELLAVLFAFRRFRHYLRGRRFTLQSDHKSLTWLLRTHNGKAVIEDWVAEVIEFSFDFVHIPGRENIIPDCLSRLYPAYFWEAGVGRASSVGMTSSGSKGPTGPTQPSFVTQLDAVGHQLDELAAGGDKARARLQKIQAAIATLQAQAVELAGPPWMAAEPLGLDGETGSGHGEPIDAVEGENQASGVGSARTPASTPPATSGVGSTHTLPATGGVGAAGRQVATAESKPNQTERLESPFRLGARPIQADRDLHRMVGELAGKACPAVDKRSEIIHGEHELGHTGGSKLFQQLYQKGLFWPGMRKDCMTAVSRCAACARQNVAREGFLPARATIAAVPWSTIAVDLMSLEPSASGNMAALVVVDVATRFVVLRALPDKKAKTVAQALLEVCAHFLMPETIVSDNGPEFVAELTQALYEDLGIKWKFLAAYNPRGNGLVERMVGVSKDALRKRLKGRRAEWDTQLPIVMLALNSRIAPITASSPSALMLGRECRAISEEPREILDSSELLADLEPNDRVVVRKLQQRWRDMHEVIYPAVAAAARERATTNERRLDAARGNRVSAPFQAGALVMIKEAVRNGTLADRYVGPVRVRERVGSSYVCESLQGEELPGLATHSRLKTATQLLGASEDGDDGAIYQVEELLEGRRRGGNWEYKVRWQGYGSEADQWVKAGDVSNDLIDAFVKKQNGMRPSPGGRSRHQRKVKEGAGRADQAGRLVGKPAGEQRETSARRPEAAGPVQRPEAAGPGSAEQAKEPQVVHGANPMARDIPPAVPQGMRRSQRTKTKPHRLRRVSEARPAQRGEPGAPTVAATGARGSKRKRKRAAIRKQGGGLEAAPTATSGSEHKRKRRSGGHTERRKRQGKGEKRRKGPSY